MIHQLNEGFIFTTQAASEGYGLNEMSERGLGISDLTRLDQGIGLARTPGGFQRLAQAFRDHPPVFIRHICPAQMEIGLTGNDQDLETLGKAARALFKGVQTPKSFSVQTVFWGEGERPYKRFELNGAVSDRLMDLSPLDVKNPEWIVSIVQGPSSAYLGVSRAKDNLSAWAGGARRFAKEPDQVSRAEFKLMEAVEAFSVALPPSGLALDFGAAPGGWTRVLRGYGLRVVAIDPAMLDPRVAQDPGVTHFKGTTQEYMRQGERCDVIVNDMRMDAMLSCQIMGEAAEILKPEGLAIMTLKLPHENQQRNVRRAMDLLSKWYEIPFARQLFHNRSEVTVLLRPKRRWVAD
ncbi:MAG TPA: methyltransferase domain-containing protein [Candidatus Faecaligallichristensenella faecipullorum]|nr:methyltransferase domain-containing protein [Candidatus Faecaligallichristensenella faecipullorum]